MSDLAKIASIHTSGPTHSTQDYLGRILIVDDDPAFRALYQFNLEREGFVVHLAASLSEMKEKIRGYSFDVILLDLCLGNEDGLDSIPYLMKEVPFTKVVVLTGHGSISSAVRAMRGGVSGFLTKEDSAETIVSELRGFVQTDTAPTLKLSDSLLEKFGFIGKSEKLKEVLATVDRMKDVTSTVLISGESGTGKELVARALHHSSKRSEGRFAAINCGAIPENLLEAELFGYKRGAFTDAKTDRRGIFEVCSEGTLFLDEIGDMPVALQVKLLRVLQEKEVVPLGSTETIKVDTRVIAATHQDLEQLVKSGKFRADLFYRLSVLKLNVPPLRERREDIPLLVEYFVRQFSERFNREVVAPSYEGMARLTAYDWPGNVRELQNVIERGVVLSSDGKLHLDDLISWMGTTSGSAKHSFSPLDEENPSLLPYREVIEWVERKYLTRLLRMASGNISEASRLSQEPRVKIYRMMRKYKLDPTRFKADQDELKPG